MQVGSEVVLWMTHRYFVQTIFVQNTFVRKMFDRKTVFLPFFQVANSSAISRNMSENPKGNISLLNFFPIFNPKLSDLMLKEKALL